MWIFKNIETGELVNPRSVDFVLSPWEVVDGAENWDDVFFAESEINLIDGFERVWVEYVVSYSATKNGETNECSVPLGDWGNWEKYERYFLDVVKRDAESGIQSRYEVKHKNDAGDWVRDLWTLKGGSGWAQNPAFA